MLDGLVRPRFRRWSLVMVVIVLGLSSAGVPERDGPHRGFVIETLSNRADLISGGDALVRVSVPDRVALDRVVVQVDGRDVTASFTPDPATGRLQGLVEGLREGPNVVTAGVRVLFKVWRWKWEQIVTAERLVITNHPRGGPVFSGPQVQPWVCATPTAQQGDDTTPHTNASGLSTVATDAQCNIAAEHRWWYRPVSAPANCAGITAANPCFRPFDPAAPASDVAVTTTDRGETVPFIVRVERGTINRGIYDLAVLADPAAPDNAGRPVFNGKVQFSFGGSTGSPRRQFAPASPWASTAPGATNDEALARGFMTAVSSLTDQAFNANQVVAAETVMMLREYINERYGPVRYIMGLGCSGGSIMQNTIASAYPGLLDGLQISCTYPDGITTASEVADCVFLTDYFASPEFAAVTAGMTVEQVNAQRAAIAGHQDQRGCVSWTAAFGQSNNPGTIPGRPPAPVPWTPPSAPRADVPNNCLLPSSMVFDPQANPTGIRCGGSELTAGIFGRAADDPTSPGRANVTRDNVGVEYGRAALLSGAITPEQFVTLNEGVGSIDADGRRTTERLPADEFALRTAYRSGLVADGRSLAKVPIIDLRGNDDSSIHHDWRSFSLRARLDAVAGGHGNHVLWRYGPTLLPPPQAGLPRRSFLLLDRWLTAIEADRSGARPEEKVLAAKPADAYDFCYLSTDTAYATEVTDQSVCDADPVLRYYSSPRQVSGGPLTENVLKCRLMPLDPTRYDTVSFSPEQWARLEAVFPDGVCDWSQRGVAQQPARPWASYRDGPGGVPLPAPPRSH
jgi:hypothetical protein